MAYTNMFENNVIENTLHTVSPTMLGVPEFTSPAGSPRMRGIFNLSNPKKSPLKALRSLGSQITAVPGGANISNTFKTDERASRQFLLKFYTLAELDKLN